MALYHVHASVISKGQAVGGSAGFARYIAREGEGHGVNHAAYIGRESHPGKDDLVARGVGGLPAWAKSGTHFFLMADRYERKDGVIARCYEIALPRELSEQGRLDLAADMRATFFERFPYTWAIHNPIDRHGAEHPHMHLMLSERRATDDVERSPKQYFARAANVGQDPGSGGVRKDRSWQGPGRLRELREGVAVLTNAALERAGHLVAVSHASHQALGFSREACVYKPFAPQEERQQVQAQREILHRDYHTWENECNRAAWHQQKAREGLRDISREAMVDYIRDKFWLQDASPARLQERAASLERTIARQYDATGRERGVDREPPAPAERSRPGQDLSTTLPAEEPRPRRGLWVRLWGRDRGQELTR